MSEMATPAGAARVFSDDRLARRAVKGDERAFAAIFDRYHQRLYRYCLAIVGDSQDAQDALQNTMVKVLRALPGEERRIKLKPWLYRIAHNESVELLRRRHETAELDLERMAPTAGLAEEAASRERLRQLITDLDELPERQRGALVMRELAGLGFAEIGLALGTSAAVARQTLYEARLGLRQMDEGREMSCEAVTRALSDGDGRVARRRDLRAHLRSCAECRRFRGEIERRERDLAALAPLPALAAAGLLQGVLGGHTAVGGSLAAGLGGGAAKTLGVSAAWKGAATVAVVAAIGVGAADRGGLVDVVPGGSGSKPGQAEQAGGAGPGADAAQPGAGQAAGSSPAAAERAAAADGAGVGAARATGVGPAPRGNRGDAETNPAAAATSPSPPSPEKHAHGKGHEKQLPSAAGHGQQTAAAHKGGHGAGSKGKGGTKSKPPHPTKPTKPAHPAPPPGPAAKQPPPAGSAPPGAQSESKQAAPADGGAAATPPSETGKP